MRKRVHLPLVPLLASLFLLATTASAQVSLTGTSYTQHFDAIGTEGLPAGFSIVTGATASAPGNTATLTTTHTDWRSTSGGFFNYASADLGSTSIPPEQAMATDRAVGIRQTGSVGDPGAGFVFQVASTTDLTGFALDFKLQSLDASSPRTTTWRVDYGFGANPTSFTEVVVTGSGSPTFTTGGNMFRNIQYHANFGTALDNHAGIVTIRIVAVTPSTGSGTRPTSALDDFVLSYTPGSTGGAALLAQPALLNFPATSPNNNSPAVTYTLKGFNLTNDVVISTASPFSISTDGVSFGGIITIPSSDTSIVTGKTIYVRFSPTAAGTFTGAVNNASTGAAPQVVATSAVSVSYFNLDASPFIETFDSIGNGLPSGVSVRTGATSGSVGTSATYSPNRTNWSSTSGGFFNYASGDIGSSEPQSTATDRALGIRQTGSFGDPGGAFVFQIANTLGKINFTLDLNLQSLDAGSTRSTTWRIDWGLGFAPTSYTTPPNGTFTTGGSTFSNTPVHIDFGNALNNQPHPITIRVVALTASSGSGTRPTTAIDDLVLQWEDPAAKTITIDSTALNFPATNIGSSSTTSYHLVTQTNLDSPVIVTATAPFTVSADGTSFSHSISVDPLEVFNTAIYVRFTPSTAGVVNGRITNASNGAASKTVTASAEGIDPSLLTFNFNSCSPAGRPGMGWAAVNTVGTQKWACSSFGLNNTNGVGVNGFNGGAQTNEAWLISPALKLDTIINMPVLSFYSRGEFTGPKLQLLVSTNYHGDPATATWTEITNANFPTPPGSPTTEWTLSDNIDLSAYKSAGTIHLAFKYTSSPTVNAARWTIDDVAITDQSTLLSVSPLQLNFGEASVGSSSPAQAVSVRAVGDTDITLSVPSGYQLSTDSVTFSTSPLVIDQAKAAAGTTIYVRFAPVAKALKVAGFINVSGTGLNKNTVALSGSSYPKAETFDVAAYNIAFFGSNDKNNATPQKITGQINNIATVLQRLNADVVAVEEVSSDSAIDVLLTKLPGHAAVLSNRWSYSFNPPDPAFPPQKIGFIYDTTTMKLSATEPPRVLFEAMYDSARLGLPGHRITNYPTGTPSSFWASGRLPYMATFDAVIDGVTRKVRLIVLHGKSSSDAESYNRRVYDVRVLKDSIDLYYRNDRVIILGDFNDRLIGSIYRGATESPYQAFVSDTAGYAPLTYSLDSAGRVSFIGGSGLIDHLVATRTLLPELIPGSTDIEDPRTYITNYNDSTASDHLPVYSRFAFEAPAEPLVIDAVVNGKAVDIKWTYTASDARFVVQRSGDGTSFTTIGEVNSTTSNQYSFTDNQPLTDTSYYRVQLVKEDLSKIFSNTDLVYIRKEDPKPLLTIWPNPVNNFALIGLQGASLKTSYTMKVTNVQNNRTLITGKGNLIQLNLLFNLHLYRLPNGVYALTLDKSNEHHAVKFIKR